MSEMKTDAKTLQTLAAGLTMLSVRIDAKGYRPNGTDIDILRRSAIHLHRQATALADAEGKTGKAAKK